MPAQGFDVGPRELARAARQFQRAVQERPVGLGERGAPVVNGDLVGNLLRHAQRAQHLAVDRHAVRVQVRRRDDQQDVFLARAGQDVLGQEHRPDHVRLGLHDVGPQGLGAEDVRHEAEAVAEEGEGWKAPRRHVDGTQEGPRCVVSADTGPGSRRGAEPPSARRPDIPRLEVRLGPQSRRQRAEKLGQGGDQDRLEDRLVGESVPAQGVEVGAGDRGRPAAELAGEIQKGDVSGRQTRRAVVRGDLIDPLIGHAQRLQQVDVRRDAIDVLVRGRNRHEDRFLLNARQGGRFQQQGAGDARLGLDGARQKRLGAEQIG